MTVAEDTLLDAVEADVRDQPAAFERTVRSVLPAAQEIGRAVQRRRISWVLVAGRGSSDNAGRYGQYLLGAEHRLAVATASPSLFTRYGTPPHLDGALVVAVSASGNSRDVVAVVEEARRQRRPTVAITNDPGSPLAVAAEHVLPLDAGEERAVTATKTFVCSMGAFAALATAWDRDGKLARDLSAIPDRLVEALDPGPGLSGAAAALATAPRATVIGRGFNLATAGELAVKLTTLTRTPAVSYSAADLISGPVRHDSPELAVLIAPSGRVLSDVLDLIPQLRRRGATIIALSDVDEVLAEADHAVPLPMGVREWLSPITAIVPGQLLALASARRQDGLTG